jgi:PAS domain-containing protein
MSQEILKQIDAPKFSFDASGNRSLIDAAFERILGRGPSGEEMRVCCEYLERAEGDARGSLVRGLINHNDFVTIR